MYKESSQINVQCSVDVMRGAAGPRPLKTELFRKLLQENG